MRSSRVVGIADVDEAYDFGDGPTTSGASAGIDVEHKLRETLVIDVNTSISWSQPFPGGHTLVHLVVSSVTVSAIMLVIVLGNVLVVVAVCRDRSLAAPQNWFIASLAVSDILVGLFIMPLSLSNELMGYWVFGNLLCELWLSTDVLLCTASILNLVLISLDRYWSITRAVEYARFRTRSCAAAMIGVVWTLSAVICFPPLVGWKRPQPVREDGLAQCVLSQEPGYIVYSTVGSFYIPLVVMIAVYLKIFHVTRMRARRSLKNNSTQQAMSERPKGDPAVQSVTPAKVQQRQDGVDCAFGVLRDCGRPSAEKVNRCQLCNGDVKCYCNASEPRNRAQLEASGSEFHQDRIYKCSVEEHPNTAADTSHNVEEDDIDVKNPRSSHTLLKANTNSELCDSGPALADNDRTALTTSTNVIEDDDEDDEDDFDTLHRSKRLPPARLERTTRFLARTNLAIIGQILLGRGSRRRAAADEGPHSSGAVTTLGDLVQARLNDMTHRRKRIARAKERRAFLVLGIVMASFVGCWLPFFSVYLVTSLAGSSLPAPSPLLFAIFFWLGYCNSALNPIIYTIFNRDFRRAFQKIIKATIRCC